MKMVTRKCAATLVLIASAALSAACGNTQPSAVATTTAQPSSQAAKAAQPKGLTVAPRVCNERKLVAALVQQLANRAKAEQDAALAHQDDDDDAKNLPPVAPDEAKKGGSFEEAYRKVAPATVLIQTDDGFGTGVVVADSGLVLTNFHVVARGLQKDFRIKVTVQFGKRSNVGGMELSEKIYEGWVVKTDRVRDLALVRVKDAPKDLTVSNLAHGDPSPGQSVAAIGHAGIGMLWAMKTCHVAAIGEPARNSLLSAKDCSVQSDTEGLSDDVAKERRTRCETSKKEAQLVASEFFGGLFVQSDCRIAPGDSGGPLIDDQARIVGLNQSVKFDQRTTSGTSYHVHVAELREFIADAPADPVHQTPDPWCDGGTDAVLEDLDMDGSADGLIASSGDSTPWGNRRFSLMMDLDGKQVPDEAAKSSMPYDAEVAYLSLPTGTFAWYDANNDGRFDVLVADPEDSGQRTAFDIAADGKLTERKSDARPFFFDAAFLPADERMKAGLGRWALAINPRYANVGLLTEARARVDVPDPVAGISPKGTLADIDKDGKPDVYRFQSMFASGSVFDLDGDSLGGLATTADPADLVRGRKLDPELSFIVERGNTWVIYDRDNDKTADLAILADTRSVDRIAKAAFTRKSSADPWKPDSDFVGLRSVRAGLLNLPNAGELLKKALPFTARKEGLASFPRALSKRASYDFAKNKSTLPPAIKPALPAKPLPPAPNKAVLIGSKPGYTLWVFDADRNSKVDSNSANALVQGKKFDAEVASIEDNSAGLIWVYYDTNHDGAFDLVLFSSHPEQGTSEKAFRIEADKVRVDPDVSPGKLYRASVLEDKTASAGFKKLSSEYLPANAVEN